MAERVWVLIVGAGLADHHRAIELVLGFRYRSSAIRTDDDDPADAESPARLARPESPQ